VWPGWSSAEVWIDTWGVGEWLGTVPAFSRQIGRFHPAASDPTRSMANDVPPIARGTEKDLMHSSPMNLQESSAEAFPALPIGSTALEVLLELKYRRPQIEEIRLVTYPDKPGFEERSLQQGPGLRDVFHRAASLAQSTNCDVPLWDIAWSLADTPDIFEQLVTQSLGHDLNGQPSQIFCFATAPSGVQHIREKIQGLRSNVVLAICSKCRLADGSVAHIPMMDFRCKSSPENQKKVESSLRGVGQKAGYILESGRSYHYYGIDLMDEKSWIQFMGKCLLLSPLVDSRYIAHRLIEGTCALRISTSERHPTFPMVVANLQERVAQHNK
jgi:hypothetical protein